MIKHKKILKPIDIDAHFKYRCPKCNIEHWVSLKEAKTKNFKVVCDCSKVFIPKRIAKIKIIYDKSQPAKKIVDSQTTKIETISSNNNDYNKEVVADINQDLLEKCQTILVGYGFTRSEASKLIKQTYYTNPSEDAVLLVKLALKSFGESSI